MSDVASYTLQRQSVGGDSDPLLHFLTGALGKPVTIDASDVTHLPARQLQLLISAQEQWASDGHPFNIDPMTEGFREGLVRLGLPDDHFDHEVTH